MKPLLCLLVPIGLVVGCAHASETRSEYATTERDVIAVEAPPASPTEEPPPAPSRPRLSKTITLGATDGYEPMPSSAATTAQPNVVVNNNITVVESAPYGGYYGYGYGYNGYGGGVRESFGARGTARPQWGSSGWEGARRTAAPGQTPGIGGNWSAPPSHGPAPMR